MTELVKMSDLSTALTNNVDTSTGGGDMSFMRFDSKGDGTFSVDDVEIEADEEFILDPRSIMHGWMCWGDQLGGAPQKEMVPIFQGPRPPKPQKLEGYKDWAKAWGCGFVSMDDEPELFFHEHNTWGWEKQYNAFVLKTLQEQFRKAPATPIVTLGNNGNRDKNGNLYPVINLVRWESVDMLEPPKPAEEEEKPKRAKRRAA